MDVITYSIQILLNLSKVQTQTRSVFLCFTPSARQPHSCFSILAAMHDGKWHFQCA